MNKNLFESAQFTVKNWWMSLIVGILFSIIGIWMIFSPEATFGGLVVVLSIFMVVSGVFEIAFALTNSGLMRGWGWYLVIGILDLLLGCYLVFNPGLMVLIIPFIIAMWLMFRGFSAIGLSIDAHQLDVRGWGWSLFFGICAVLCSIMIIWNPFAGAALAVVMTSMAFIFIGIFRISFAFGLKRINKRLKE